MNDCFENRSEGCRFHRYQVLEGERKGRKGKKGGKVGTQRCSKVFFEGRAGLIAGHYLPKLPRRANIRIKDAANAPLRPISSSLHTLPWMPLENQVFAPFALLLLLLLLTLLVTRHSRGVVERARFRDSLLLRPFTLLSRTPSLFLHSERVASVLLIP